MFHCSLSCRYVNMSTSQMREWRLREFHWPTCSDVGAPKLAVPCLSQETGLLDLSPLVHHHLCILPAFYPLYMQRWKQSRFLCGPNSLI